MAPPYSVKQGVPSLAGGGRERDRDRQGGETLQILNLYCVISISAISYINPSLIRPLRINTENEAFRHVDTQITVAEGTIKQGTSGLFLSHTLTQSSKHTYST